MEFDETKRPKVGVSVLLFKEDLTNVLIGKRKGSHGAGSYGFAGGHMEYGEHWFDTATREVYEEAGMVLYKPRLVGIVNTIIPEWKHPQYLDIVVVGIGMGEPKIMEPEKCDGWMWCYYNTINTLNNKFEILDNVLKTLNIPNNPIVDDYLKSMRGDLIQIWGSNIVKENKNED